MSYSRFDDGYHDDPRVDAATVEALALNHLANTWSARHLTDGVVSLHRAVKLLAGRTLADGRVLGSEDVERAAANLCAVKLWKPHADGYQIVDFLTTNWSAARIRRYRKAEAKRQREIRRRSGVRTPVRTSESVGRDGTGKKIQGQHGSGSARARVNEHPGRGRRGPARAEPDHAGGLFAAIAAAVSSDARTPEEREQAREDVGVALLAEQRRRLEAGGRR